MRSFRHLVAVLLSLCLAGRLCANATFSLQGVDVPDSVMSIVEQCAGVWSNYVESEVEIRVSVSWQELKSNVNAYAKPTNYYSMQGVYYPCALAEKIQRTNLNGNDADIEVVINKNIDWQKYDLTTTLIHEFAHGLGLIGNITEETLASSEFPSPTIYDMLICDDKNMPIIKKQTDTYAIRNDLITSDNLYWGGRFAKAYCGEVLKLHAPKGFNSGSTAYHLSEDTYPSGSAFALMTPTLSPADVYREPDVATIAMLADIGWTDFFVSIGRLPNCSDLSQPATVTTSMKDTLFAADKQFILYSFDAGNHSVALNASATKDGSRYQLSATIPALAFDHTILYRFVAVTSNNDTITVPQNYPSEWFTVFFGDDTESPSIEHTPIQTAPVRKKELTFSAKITDNFAVDSAYVSYFIRSKGVAVQDTVTTKMAFSYEHAEAVISLTGFDISEGDELLYTIVAVDKSKNTALLFGDEYHTIVFEAEQAPLPFFITDFESDTVLNYFNLDKFSIQKADGFANKALHSAHPYASSGADGKYNQYIATLKSPIVLTTNPATMSFDEIVLVEPGKAGVEFGTFGFWDFVVVEASKDLEAETWQPLGKKGWDSQLSSLWKARYHSLTKTEGENENSYAVGDQTLYRNHSINLLENKYFRPGDTIFVRFRLQADATNFGWGWAIDNLKIQERIALPVIPLAASQAKIYPNPCKEILHVDAEHVAEVTLYNVSGRQVLQTSGTSVDVASLPQGVYTVEVRFSDGRKEIRRIVKE